MFEGGLTGRAAILRGPRETDQTASATRDTAIKSATRRCEVASQQLGEALQVLRERLEPILRVAPPSPGQEGKSTTSDQPPLAVWIQTRVSDYEIAAQFVRDLIERIEL